MTTRVRWRMTLMVYALAGFPLVSFAADAKYPTKPVRWVVPYAAGGPTEVIARIVGQKLSGAWGQQVVIDLRPGANSIIGTEIVANSQPDGYTMLVALPAFVINPHVYTKLSYRIADFIPVTNIASASYLMLVTASLSVKTPQDLIALAKAAPGKYNYGSGGTASPAHLAMELFAQRAGIVMTHVPYKGGAPALIDLIAARIQVLVNPALSSATHVKSGRIRAIAVTGSTHSRLFPQLPTVAEAGLKGYEVMTWYGVFAPAKTSRPIVNAVAKDVASAVDDPQVREQITALDADAVGSSPADFTSFVAAEERKWKGVVETAHIRLER